MKAWIEIGERKIGPSFPTYLIAEMSGNHNQDFDSAVGIIRAAKEAGADAVKIQTYTPDTLTLDCNNEYFRIEGTIWEGKTLYDLYGEAYTPWEWQPKLKEVCEDLALDFFSTPFDHTAVDFLEEISVMAYKVASFEIVDLPLLRKMARTGKPIIMSTGMATLAEIAEAVQAVGGGSGNQLALLKCTSAYPAPPEDMNLRAIPHLSETFGVPVGLSDHTLGAAVSVAAVAMGACIIEKHLTLSRDIPGPDSSFSMTPEEFREMAKSVRTVEKALGRVSFGPGSGEEENLMFRRSLFVVEDVKQGDPVTEKTVRSIRPGHGLAPRYLDDVIGRVFQKDVRRGTPLSWDLI